MEKGRIEAFSDGVIAVIITIMVLELKVPHGSELSALASSLPVFLGYVLSFIYVGIYWNNHHHMFQLIETVDGTMLWANLHLLFWLSLLPFTTEWMGDNHLQPWPTTLYGINLLLCALSWYLLQFRIVRHQGQGGKVATALQGDFKGKASPFLYVSGIVLTWLVGGWAGMAMFVFVACLWFVPDQRFERMVRAKISERGED